MISVSVIDKASKQPFLNFIHNTTTYVGVPHTAETVLWVANDEPCFLGLEADCTRLTGTTKQVTAPGDGLVLSALKQPLVLPGPRSGFVPGFLRRRAIPKPQEEQPRLYAFRAMVSKDPGEIDILSTVDFHLLCEFDYRWALAIHLELQSNPQALGSQTIWERAEGTCPTCATVRARLQRDWTPENLGTDETP